MELINERLRKRFDERYEFRLAKRNDIPAIMEYIDTCWRKGHILGKNRELFEYEFCDGDDVHFLLAIDRKTGCIEGLDGYYYTSSRRTPKEFDVWGSMWSVRKDHKNLPLLGIAIANNYFEKVGFRYEIGVGVNAMTATPLHQEHFNVATGILKHYYMLKRMSEYRIAKIVEPHYYDIDTQQETYALVQADSIDQVNSRFHFENKITTYPYKDGWYVGHRFFEHPIYKYNVMLIMNSNDEADAVMVLRNVELFGHHVLRIVDYMGDIAVLKKVRNQVYNLMDNTCEYIDFYCYGYDEKAILNAGFTERKKEDENIIPSYFEPFEQKNVEYWFNSDAKDNFVICKADADQDRPNIIIN